jgi:hypothetical protein
VASIENRREAFGLAQWLEAQESGTLPRTSIGVVLRMVSAECRDMGTLPRTSIGVVLRMGTVLAIVARAGRPFVTQAPLHHDEIFQSIEMAHIWVFGTGIRPCEFSSNPDARFTSDIHYQRMRSPIYPAVFAAVLYIADALGLGYHMTALPLCLLLQAAVSGLLPLALAHFVRNICDEPLAPPLAALAVALYPQLVVLGSHTLVVSFCAPAVFGCLGSIAGTLRREAHVASLVAAASALGLVMYVRPDSALLPALWLITTAELARQPLHAAALLSGVTFGACVGGAVDYAYYGDFFCSPLYWLKFNVLDGKAERFGATSRSFYWANVCTHDRISTALFLLGALGTLGTLARAIPRTLRCALLQTVAVTTAGFCVHSFVPRHMEVRFVHDLIVMYLLTACLGTLVLAHNISLTALWLRLEHRSLAMAAAAAAAVVAAAALAAGRYSVADYYACDWATSPRSSVGGQERAEAAWSARHYALSHSLLPALALTGARADVTGIIIDGFEEVLPRYLRVLCGYLRVLCGYLVLLPLIRSWCSQRSQVKSAFDFGGYATVHAPVPVWYAPPERRCSRARAWPCRPLIREAYVPTLGSIVCSALSTARWCIAAPLTPAGVPRVSGLAGCATRPRRARASR